MRLGSSSKGHLEAVDYYILKKEMKNYMDFFFSILVEGPSH